jgi:hypothetical protein
MTPDEISEMRVKAVADANLATIEPKYKDLGLAK